MGPGHRTRGFVMLVCCVLAAAAWAGVLTLLKRYEVVENPRGFRLLSFPFAGDDRHTDRPRTARPRSTTRRDWPGWNELAGWQPGLVGLPVVAIAVDVIVTNVTAGLRLAWLRRDSALVEGDVSCLGA